MLRWPINRLAVLVCLLAPAISGCGNDFSGHWAPLEVGRIWTYRAIRANPGQTETVKTMVVSVVASHKEYKDSVWVERRYGPHTTKEMWSRIKDPDGYSFWISRTGPGTVPECPLFIPPPRSGWAYTGRERDSPLCRFVGRRRVTVPAGVFENCLLTSLEPTGRGGDLRRLNFWFADGVGLVRYAEIVNGKAAYVLELIKYSVTPPGN